MDEKMVMDSSRIFVKGLPPTITEADLRKHFSTKGHITDIKCLPHRRIGYIGYKTPQEAAAAVRHFNRSFIRLSKITVENAKPVSDPSLPKRKHPKQGQTTQHAVHNNGHAHSTDDKSATSKKRKREAPDGSDPKLKEFLDVMQPAKKTAKNIHEDEHENVVGLTTNPDIVVTDEGASDDEYQTVLSRKPNIPLQSTRNLVTPPSTARHDAPQQETSNDEAGKNAGEISLSDESDNRHQSPAAGAVVADDDGWLRSRTNRLLDLVDNSEVAEPTTLPHQSPIEDENAEDIRDDQEDAAVTYNSLPSVSENKNETIETIRSTSRLFVRNIPYSTTEDDLKKYFEKFGSIEEVHVPTDSSNSNRGMGFVLFSSPDDAVKAYDADRSSFQGRILHILPASAKRDHDLDEFALSKLPLKQQNLIKKRHEAAASRWNWNSLFMSQDAVNSSVAERLGLEKSQLLDPTDADAAVRQAIFETSTIQDTKAYFAANGIDLNAFRSSGQRSDTTILVKNFPFGTSISELRRMFEEHGQISRVLMPPTGVIAIVQFAQAPQAKAAFAKLAYRRFKDSMLFLEKAPKGLFVHNDGDGRTAVGDESGEAGKSSVSKLLESAKDDSSLETSSLFVKNLSWSTTTDILADAFKELEGFRSAQVKTKKDPNKPGQVLSMGFGFVSFATPVSAAAALKMKDGSVLMGHKLEIRASHRGRDAAEERKKEHSAKKAAGQTKLVIKNVPFQASKRDIRTLFSSYGQLRSVRLPSRGKNSRGFAFAEFVSPKEAESAMLALRDTHLLGRRLVLQYAEAEAVDPEEEIEKMQKKVGGQVSKVALQQLTGKGRTRVTLAGDEEEGEI